MKLRALWLKVLLVEVVLWLTLGVSYGQDPRPFFQLGLQGGEFTSSSGSQFGGLDGIGPGYVTGFSYRYSGTSNRGEAPWFGNLATGLTTRIGLFDASYTSSAGVQYSITLLTDGEYASGSSQRFSGVSTFGQAAWVANSRTGVTTRIGLFGANYTRTDSLQNSYISNQRGSYVVGSSQRFNGGVDRGRAAWVANGATGISTRLGLIDAVHTRDDGYQWSLAQFISGNYAGGLSYRYSGATLIGQAAWVANAQTGISTRVGLFGAEYTFTSTGGQFSEISQLEDGIAAGYSNRYSGNVGLGQTAWAASVTTGTTTRVGFYDAAYTRNDGYQTSGILSAKGGNVTGESTLYSGTNSIGNALWIANGQTGVTVRIGLAGAEFTGSNGGQFSVQTHFAGGVVAGYSRRQSTGTGGQGAWLARAADGTTVRVGLFDAPYTSSEGRQESTVRFLEGNYAAGVSTKYSGLAIRGQAAWVAGAISGETTRIGLYGSAYTMTDGGQTSDVTAMGGDWAAGFSRRYGNGGQSDLGQTAWVFNLQTKGMDEITLSLRPSDGYASATVAKIFSTGLAIGEYIYFDAQTPSGVARPFAYTPEDGAFDLASTVFGGISTKGWSALSSADLVDPTTGAIVGLGSLTAGGTGVFVSVPEPASAILFGAGAFGFLSSRARRRSGC